MTCQVAITAPHLDVKSIYSEEYCIAIKLELNN